MECPDITNLKLDQDDQKALEEIRRVERAGNMLQVVMPAGVLAEIFLGNNAAQAAYTISDLQSLDTVFDPDHPIVVEGEYVLEEHESGQRIMMRFPDLLKPRRNRGEWLQIEIYTLDRVGR